MLARRMTLFDLLAETAKADKELHRSNGVRMKRANEFRSSHCLTRLDGCWIGSGGLIFLVEGGPNDGACHKFDHAGEGGVEHQTRGEHALYRAHDVRQ